MSYASEVLADSPRVYYRMDNASGALTDSSGNGLNTNDPGAGNTYSQPGAIASDPSSTSIRIVTTEFARVDDALLDLANTFSLEGWIKRNATGAHNIFFNKNTNAYQMRVSTDDKLYLVKTDAGDIANSTVTIPADGAFYHCVCTYTGVTAHVYVDAVDVTNVFGPTTFADNASSLLVGGGAGFPSNWNGWLDELAVYATVLTPARVLAHYNAALSAAGPGDDPPIGFLGRGAGW